MSIGHNGAGVYGGNAATLAADLAGTGSVNSYGLSGYWGPSVSSWIPNISAGWGITTDYNFDGDENILSSNGPYDGYGIDGFTSRR